MGNTVQIHDKQFGKFISSKKIQAAVSKIAKQINKDFKNERPVFISVLNGSFIFTADLLTQVNLECEVTFVKVASYKGVISTGTITTLIGVNEDLRGRSVIILEDIVDSGNTISKLVPELKGYNPKQIKIAALLFKPNAYKKKLRLDYIGIEVPDDFLVGYGLDYNGLGRNLSDIYTLKH